MCKCNPAIRTPFCGKGDCQWSEQNPEKINMDEQTILNEGIYNKQKVSVFLEGNICGEIIGCDFIGNTITIAIKVPAESVKKWEGNLKNEELANE